MNNKPVFSTYQTSISISLAAVFLHAASPEWPERLKPLYEIPAVRSTASVLPTTIYTQSADHAFYAGLVAVYNDLAKSQIALGAEFEQIVDARIRDLYQD